MYPCVILQTAADRIDDNILNARENNQPTRRDDRPMRQVILFASMAVAGITENPMIPFVHPGLCMISRVLHPSVRDA